MPIINGTEARFWNGTSGLGLNLRLRDRMDLGASRPGYVHVANQSLMDTPEEPYFISVTAENGQIAVQLGCTETVDSYQLTYATSNAPNLNNILNSESGYFIWNITGTIYLFARTVLNNAVSSWVAYGEVSEGSTEYTLVWDDADIGSRGSDTAVPNLDRGSGTQAGNLFRYYNWAGQGISVSLKYYSYLSPQKKEWRVFNAASGVQLGKYGGKHNWKQNIIDKANVMIGVIFKAEVGILSSITGETYYVLGLQYVASNDVQAKLYTGNGTTLTEVATSGNLHSDFGTYTTGSTQYNLTFECNDTTFTVSKDGASIWSTTDTAIASSDTRIYTGLYGQGPTGSPSTQNAIYDIWKIYARDLLGSGQTVDPGTVLDPYLPLDPGDLATGGAANDVLGIDNAGTTNEWKEVLGTTNQVTVTHAAGTITWALTQDIHIVGDTYTEALRIDANTHITKDGDNNMTFTDAVTGTRTLKTIGCPVYRFIKVTGQAEGDLHLSDGTEWNVNKALINIIRVQTTSTDWDLWILQNDNGYAADDANIPKMQLMDAGSGDADILVNLPYEDEDASNEVHLYYVDNSGTATADIFVIGYELV